MPHAQSLDRSIPPNQAHRTTDVSPAHAGTRPWNMATERVTKDTLVLADRAALVERGVLADREALVEWGALVERAAAIDPKARRDDASSIAATQPITNAVAARSRCHVSIRSAASVIAHIIADSDDAQSSVSAASSNSRVSRPRSRSISATRAGDSGGTSTALIRSWPDAMGTSSSPNRTSSSFSPGRRPV